MLNDGLGFITSSANLAHSQSMHGDIGSFSSTGSSLQLSSLPIRAFIEPLGSSTNLLDKELENHTPPLSSIWFFSKYTLTTICVYRYPRIYFFTHCLLPCFLLSSILTSSLYNENFVPVPTFIYCTASCSCSYNPP